MGAFPIDVLCLFDITSTSMLGVPPIIQLPSVQCLRFLVEYSVTLDDDNPLTLTSIKVLGRLIFQNEESMSYSVDLTYLYISGSVVAGSEIKPFLGSLHFGLLGDNTTPVYGIVDPPGSVGTTMGAKVIGVYYFYIKLKKKLTFYSCSKIDFTLEFFVTNCRTYLLKISKI